MTTKREHYENLLTRADNAYSKEYFLEASWIAYAIIEDRMVSILNLLNTSPPIMLGRKVGAVSAELQNSLPLRQTVMLGLLDRINKWAQDPNSGRNFLMHQMANEAEDFDVLQQKSKFVAENGIELAKELSASVMRFKNRIEKLSRQSNLIDN